MPLSDDELQNIEDGAYLCDGEGMDVFIDNVMPVISKADAGYILALAGAFAGRFMFECARFLAEYGREVWMSNERPDVYSFWAKYLEEKSDEVVADRWGPPLPL